MKRAIMHNLWIIVVLLVSVYFVNSYLENRAKREDEKVEAERIEKATKAAVTQLVERTNAVHNWEKELSKGEGFRLEPILTLELERLWLTGRPILFVGSIKDISTIDHENYRIKIERGMFTSIEYEYMFWTELQLALQCPKQMADSFLNEHPDLFKDLGIKNGVAVVANIDEIETIIVSGTEGEREEIKVGKGKCIDMLYTGDVQF